MIARTWRGATRASDADAYVEYLSRTGFAEYAATPGNVGVLGLRRLCGDRAEFLLVSLWDTPEAIARFAGREPARAVFYPDDDAYLVERDEHVDHYDVVHQEWRSSGEERRQNAIHGLLDRVRVWWRRLWTSAPVVSAVTMPRRTGEGWTLIGIR